MPGKSEARQIAEREMREAVQIALGSTQGKYFKAFDRRAHGYALLGHTNNEIAELLGVPARTFDDWLVAHPSLKAAVTRARFDDNVRLVRSLHRAGNGYKHRETKVFNVDGALQTIDVTKHYPPNVNAAMAVLSNRAGAQWQDKRTVDHTGKIDLAGLVQASMGDDAKLIEAKPVEDDAGE